MSALISAIILMNAGGYLSAYLGTINVYNRIVWIICVFPQSGRFNNVFSEITSGGIMLTSFTAVTTTASVLSARRVYFGCGIELPLVSVILAFVVRRWILPSGNEFGGRYVRKCVDHKLGTPDFAPFYPDRSGWLGGGDQEAEIVEANLVGQIRHLICEHFS